MYTCCNLFSVGGVIHSCIWELSKKNFNVSSGINYHLFNKVFVKDVVSRVFKYSTDTEVCRGLSSVVIFVPKERLWDV